MNTISAEESYKPSPLRSFKTKGFPTYWFAMMAQMAGLNMQMVSRAWLIYELSASYTILGAMTVAHALPMLFTSMFGGVLADRFLKKRLMQSGQILLAITSLFVAVCLSLDLIDLSTGAGVSYVMMASVFQGTIMGFTMPSRQAVIPEIVGRENLTNAIALNQSGMNLNRLAAPGVAGLMIALLGITTVYYFMTFLYILATIIISFLPITKSLNPHAKEKSPMRDLIDGFKYIFNETVIFYLLLATLFSVVLSMPYMGLMPIFAKDIQVVIASDFAWMNSTAIISSFNLPELLTYSSFRLGCLMSISGIGALIGSLIVTILSDSNRGKLFIYSVLALGITLTIFSFTRSFIVGCVSMMFVGFFQSLRLSLSNALVQSYVSDEFRGRVMSVYMMEFGMTSFSTFLVATMAGVIDTTNVFAPGFGIQLTMGIAAILLIPGALIFCFGKRSLLNLG